VYTGLPSAKRVSSDEVEVLVPLHCQNLIGAVEVVLRLTAPDSNSAAPAELRQLTGCTSDRTMIKFDMPQPKARRGSSRVRTEILVLDNSGALLTHSLAPIPIR